MDALFNALSEYIDFLVLGAVALAALCAPFGLTPLAKGWIFLRRLLRRGNTAIQAGLIAGVLFALLYFSGYFLNAIGAAFVHRAHVGIVDTVATFDPNESRDSILGLKRVVFVRVVPVIGPFLSNPGGLELKNYWRDARRQFFWQVCDQKSADEMLAGGLLKELRLLRGAIGLAQILIPLCLFVAFYNWRAARRDDEGRGRIAWPLGTLAVALGAYCLLIIPSYSVVEYDAHITIWSAFPADLDKTRERIDVDQMDQLLPCRKMKIMAEKSKDKEDTAGKGALPPSNPPKPN